jgi:hypothetical protein
LSIQFSPPPYTFLDAQTGFLPHRSLPVHETRVMVRKKRERCNQRNHFSGTQLAIVVPVMDSQYRTSAAEKGNTMERKGLWIKGLALAALLAVSHNAQAHVRVGLRVWHPFPRHEVIVAYPGPVWVAGYRGWDRARHVWLPGRWVARHPGRFRVEGRPWHRAESRGYRGYWRGS